MTEGAAVGATGAGMGALFFDAEGAGDLALYVVEDCGDLPGSRLACADEAITESVDFVANEAGNVYVVVDGSNGEAGEFTLAWGSVECRLDAGGDIRVALFFMDYPNRRRLKLLGHARLVEDDPALLARLAPPGRAPRAEAAMLIEVAGFEWNCPQHITPRYSVAEWAALARE